MLKKILFLLGLILALVCFYFFSIENYKKHLEIRDEFISHPESLVKPSVAKKTTFGFSNLRADIYWLQAVQYIGGNAISSAYKKYLYAILDLTTELNPYFEHPYITGMLLLPEYNGRYEDLEEDQQKVHTYEALKLGLKGIENFCDQEKMELVANEYDLIKIWSEEKYKNPCKSDMIPYSLAFLYYYYLHEPLEAAKYYKIASSIEESVEGARVMAAIMQGKGGDREKSIYMFLNMGRNIEDDEVCNMLSLQLENIMNGLLSKDIAFTGKLVKTIEEARAAAFGEFNDETEKDAMADAKCQNYANKAVREMNLLYLETANSSYKEKNNGNNANNSKELFDAGFIDYVPKDFQQYEDYGIIYEYNKDTGNFDYTNGVS